MSVLLYEEELPESDYCYYCWAEIGEDDEPVYDEDCVFCSESCHEEHDNGINNDIAAITSELPWWARDRIVPDAD